MGGAGFETADAFIVRPLLTLGHISNGDADLVIGGENAASNGEPFRFGLLGDFMVDAGAD